MTIAAETEVASPPPSRRRGFAAGLSLLALAALPGCSLVKVNGKPLSTWSSSSSSSGEAQPTPEDGGGAATGAAASGSDDANDTAGKRFEDIAMPEDTAGYRGWTPIQQYLELSGGGPRGAGKGPEDSSRWRGVHNSHREPFGKLLFADELGDRLSQLGRIAVLETCFAGRDGEVAAAVAWAVCSGDLAAVSLPKLEAELVAAGIGTQDRELLLTSSRARLEAARQLGAHVEALAKEDTGVAAILAAGKAAREEWAAFASAHREELALLDQLQDLARSGKQKGGEGCVEKTRPAFEQVVRATRYTEDDDQDPMLVYVRPLRATTEGYLATLAYAACAWSQDESGESIYVAASNGHAGELRRGPRSLAIAKLSESSFHPRFQDRAFSAKQLQVFGGTIEVTEANWVTSIMTPGGGKVKSMTKVEEHTQLRFDSYTVDRCTDWRDTSKVATISAGGSVMYEKVCMHREKTRSEAGDVEIPSAYADGIARGMVVITVNKFPVVARKGDRLAAVLGVALK